MENSLFFLNLALALFAGWMCICRMGLMRGGLVKPSIRWDYVVWLTALVASVVYGWREVTVGHLALTAGVVAHLLIGFGAWRHGLPWYAVRKP